MSAIDEFFEFEKESSAKKSQKDLELWQQWNDHNRDPEAIKPLLQQMKPFIYRKANVFAGKNPQVPAEAVRAEFLNSAVKAFETYDPEKGAALHTYVDWQMLKAKRFVSTYGGGVSRIPEQRYWKVQRYQDARTELLDQLHREPTGLELADKLGWPLKDVTAISGEARTQIASTRLAQDQISLKPSASMETLRLLMYELTPEEQLVVEYTYGINGKPELKPGQIATQMRVSPSKVSRIKSKVAGKLKRYEGL